VDRSFHDDTWYCLVKFAQEAEAIFVYATFAFKHQNMDGKDVFHVLFEADVLIFQCFRIDKKSVLTHPRFM